VAPQSHPNDPPVNNVNAQIQDSNQVNQGSNPPAVEPISQTQSNSNDHTESNPPRVATVNQNQANDSSSPPVAEPVYPANHFNAPRVRVPQPTMLEVVKDNLRYTAADKRYSYIQKEFNVKKRLTIDEFMELERVIEAMNRAEAVAPVAAPPNSQSNQSQAPRANHSSRAPAPATVQSAPRNEAPVVHALQPNMFEVVRQNLNFTVAAQRYRYIQQEFNVRKSITVEEFMELQALLML